MCMSSGLKIQIVGRNDFNNLNESDRTKLFTYFEQYEKDIGGINIEWQVVVQQMVDYFIVIRSEGSVIGFIWGETPSSAVEGSSLFSGERTIIIVAIFLDRRLRGRGLLNEIWVNLIDQMSYLGFHRLQIIPSFGGQITSGYWRVVEKLRTNLGYIMSRVLNVNSWELRDGKEVILDSLDFDQSSEKTK